MIKEHKQLTFGKWIETWLNGTGLEIEDVGKNLGILPDTLRKIYAGAEMDDDTAKRLAKLMIVDYTFILRQQEMFKKGLIV